MNFEKLHIIYFSATGTTECIVNAISDTLKDIPQQKCNLLLHKPQQQQFMNTDLVVMTMPVYSGRIPQYIKAELNFLKGDNTPIVLIVVYGNRAFEDALVEMQDMVIENGFIPISAAAFIAQHSIFPGVASGRPNATDLETVTSFIRNTIAIESIHDNPLAIQGNRPYRAIKAIPLRPKTSKACNNCGVCARQCPVGAISAVNPRCTDKSLCISCAHCIAICPKHAKHFGGLLYWIASKKFTKAFAMPQQPYMVYQK